MGCGIGCFIPIFPGAPTTLRVVMIALVMVVFAACDGSISPASVPDGGTGLDGAPPSDATRDGALDSTGRRDALGAPDSVNDVEAFDAFLRPPQDAARFDGCAPNPCQPGQACLNNLSYTGQEMYANCLAPPRQCGSAPTCMCVVQAAPWCFSPICTTDGGLALLCRAVAPP